MNGFHRADQGLGGHAADIHAGAADSALAYDNDPCACLGCGDGGGESGRAAADDENIRFRVCGVCGFDVPLNAVYQTACLRH
jgi:hypothetical protein